MPITMLQFDFNEVIGSIVSSVTGTNPLIMGDGTSRYDAIDITIERHVIQISVNHNTDEVSVDLIPLPSLASRGLAILADIIGQPIEWCWIGRDYRGYLDMFTLSCSGITPQFSFVGAGSSVQVFTVNPA